MQDLISPYKDFVFILRVMRRPWGAFRMESRDLVNFLNILLAAAATHD